MVHCEKSQPAPSCLEKEKLKKSGDYKCHGVLEKIKDDFYNKCYICENKEPVTINVEHFRPHKGDNNLKFDWDNLYWSCGHCNNIKSDNFGNILDCTDPSHNVEESIKLYMRPFPNEKVRIFPQNNSLETKSTASLLNNVYNGTTVLKTIEASNLRNKILFELIDFQERLCEYAFGELDPDDKRHILMKIKKHLNRKSSFASFKRWVIRDNEEFMKEFKELLK